VIARVIKVLTLLSSALHSLSRDLSPSTKQHKPGRIMLSAKSFIFISFSLLSKPFHCCFQYAALVAVEIRDESAAGKKKVKSCSSAHSAENELIGE
jgi:hypothetical protein